MKKSTMIVIGVIVVAILWAVFAYNGMVGKQESATTELANVQATYQRRADLLPNLTKTVKAYAKHEKETFEAVTKARTEATQIKLDAESLTPENLQPSKRHRAMLLLLSVDSWLLLKTIQS